MNKVKFLGVLNMSITNQIDKITHDSDSAEASLVNLRTLQYELSIKGELSDYHTVKAFADEWEDIIQC